MTWATGVYLVVFIYLYILWYSDATGSVAALQHQGPWLDPELML